MPNYPTHARWGRIGAVTMAIALGAAIFVLFESPLLAGAVAFGAAAATFVGAIYPDIDHHKSVPRRKAVRAFRVLVVLGVFALVVLNWGLLVAAVEETTAEFGVDLPVPAPVVAGAIPVVCATVLAALVDPMVGIVTRQHRGWTHSTPINFVLVGLLAGGIWLLTGGLELPRRVAAVAVVETFFLGSCIHLGLDGELI